MDKVKIYNQIETFFNSKETKNDSKKIGEKYFYVDSTKAKESASFIDFLLKENKIKLGSNINVMDLCFGSGNLTSHVLLDNDLELDNVYFNDIDTKVTNQDIKIDEKSQILNHDFLNFKNFKKWKNSIDIVVFNPTISDGDIHRKISIKESDEVVEYKTSLDVKVAFREYCKGLSLNIIDDIIIDRENKTITVHINGTKKFLEKLPNSFNNFSLICKTKSMQNYEYRASVVSKINQTISEILKDEGLVVFVGTDKQREVIFQSYKMIFRYLRDDNDVFILYKSESESLECFEKKENDFIKNNDCTLKKANDDIVESFDDIEVVIDTYDEDKDMIKKEKETMEIKEEKFISQAMKYKFSHKNLLLKGVPGTGKSHTLDKIIKDKLKLTEKEHKENILRINIHSASSNADLMQGIGINSKDGNIEYKEKQGLIYNHIKKALFAPNQPFVLVLEEIQENSLNELIGDLIYLIEDQKRVTVDATKFKDGEKFEYQKFIEEVLKDEDNKHYIEIPYLVDTSTDYRKMVLPSNLYIFCTSNYRDDKKVIEDNLLRRFDVVEIYPQTQEQLGKSVFKSSDISDFLEKLNQAILEKFEDEIHPDRYLVGHSNWLEITDEENEENKKLFYTALLKVIIEFKEIREVDFDTYTKKILNILKDDTLSQTIKSYIDECSFEYKSYKEMVEKLQKKIYDFVK